MLLTGIFCYNDSGGDGNNYRNANFILSKNINIFIIVIEQ